MNKIALVLLLFTVMFSLTNAGIGETINNLCVQTRGVMPLVAFTLIVLGGLIYAAGQVLGAEMRSRTNVWATTMVIGAIIGLIISASAPAIISIVASALDYDLSTYPYTCEEII